MIFVQTNHSHLLLFASAIKIISEILCSVGFYQMAKIAVTPTIVLAEFMLFKKRISMEKVRDKLKFPAITPFGTYSFFCS